MKPKWINYQFLVISVFMAAALVGMLYVDRVVAVSNTTEKTVLFFDDFSGNLSQWSNLIGTWNIDQGELVGQGAGGSIDAWIYAGEPSWTDYELQAKVTFVNDNAILVLRSTGHWQNEYRIDLWQYGGENSNSYQVIKYQDGVAYDLTGGIVLSPVQIINPSVVKAQVSANRLFLYINGQFVDEIDDPAPLTSGRLGLGVIWSYTARFDDVQVTTLPPIMLLLPEQYKFSKPGAMVTYTFELENHTGISDTFNLEVLDGNIWTTTLSTNQVGPIEDGESITFTTQVDILPTSQPGDFDFATIQASSIASPSVKAAAILNTTATSEELAYVPMGSNNGLAVIEIQTHTTLGTIDMAQFGCVSPQRARLTPDGKELYVMCENSHNIIVLDTSNLSKRAEFDRPGACTQDVAFVQSGTYALASSNPCLPGSLPIDVIDTSSHTIVQSIPTPNYSVTSIAAHPFLPLAYAAAVGPSGAVLVIDTNTFSVQTSIPYGGYVWDVQPSPDGQWVYASEYYGNGLAKIKVSTNTIVDTLPSYGRFGLAISPDGRTIYASEESDVITVIDATSMDLLTNIGIGATTYEVELTCDGSELYVAREASSIPVIDTQDYSIPYDIPIQGTSSGYGIAICPQNLGNIFTRKIVDKPVASPGELVSYLISASNFNTHNMDNVVITDTLPISLTFKEGSLSASSGMANYQAGVITWTGSITASTTVTVTFGATVSPTAMIGSSIINKAVISAEGKINNRRATFDVIPAQIFLPCAFKPCLPSYSDDFSNPDSGWPIEGGSDYSMGYINGEYFIAVNPGWIAWAVQDFGASDFQVEVDARPAANLDGGAGILFAANDNGFYLFEISDGWYGLWRNDTTTWTWTTLIDWTNSPAINPGYQTNRLKVVRMGSNLTVYANGQMLSTISDGTYRGSWLGLTSEAWSAYYNGHFDNFTLYTGTCIGAQGAPIALNRTSAFDAIWTKPATGPGRP